MIQPGDPSVFPWLNKIARNFEYYKVKRLSARYENACSTTTPGQILLFWDYDVSDPVPGTFAQASVMSGNKLSAPWDHFQLAASTAAIHRQEPAYYVAASATANRLNDACSLMICTIPPSGSESVVWGNIWLDFTVEFSVPAYETSVSEEQGTLTIYEQPVVNPTIATSDGSLINDATAVSPVLDGLSLGPISPQTSLSVGGMVQVPPGRYRVGTTPNVRGTIGSTSNSQVISTATSFAVSDSDNIVAAVTTPASSTSAIEPNALAGSYQYIVDAFERVLDLPVMKWLAPIMDYTVQDIAELAITEATSFFVEYVGPSLLLAESKSLADAESKFYSKYLHSTVSRHERLRRPLHPETARKLLAVSDEKSLPRLLSLERFNDRNLPPLEAGRPSRPSRPLPSISSSPSPPPSHRDSSESCHHCPN
jgi:hypothetical protein